MDIIRFIGLYIIFIGIIINFNYFAFKILKDKHRDVLTYNYALCYIIISFGICLNLIYVTIFNPVLVSLLYRIALLSIPISFFFLLNFNLNLLKIKSNYSLKKQIFLTLFYIFLFATIILTGDIRIDKSSDWKPQYSLSFTIIFITTFTIFLTIPIIYTIYKIYSSLTIIEMKKKVQFFIIGTFGYFSQFYFLIIYNSTSNFITRVIWLIYTPSSFIYAYFIYKGYIKSLK
ncbi:MAG: hypothetical protein ACTSQP_23705 [Promethearchaeota archaeon]